MPNPEHEVGMAPETRPTEAHIQIRRHGWIGPAELLLNGIDIANVVSGVSLEMDGPNRATVITLSLIASVTHEDQAEVRLDEQAIGMLTHLGWTPPAEDQA